MPLQTALQTMLHDTQERGIKGPPRSSWNEKRLKLTCIRHQMAAGTVGLSARQHPSCCLEADCATPLCGSAL